ncbi:molecular chaperone DnaK, partial [candidate division WOR-3 bacterium]|nr:molecular chaperone DnaK [candidate division WOR-3 bacterium]
KDGVSAKEKENIENEIKELREAIKGEDIMNIRNKMEILQKTSHSIAEKLYKKAGAQAEGTGAGGPGAEGEPAAGKEKEETKKEEEEEVEADYEVIDEEEEGKEDEKS